MANASSALPMRKRNLTVKPGDTASQPRAGPIPMWPGLIIAPVVGLIYLGVASQGTFHFRQSPFPHHVLIADAWLHGQLHVREETLQARSESYYRQYRDSVEQRLRLRGQRLSDAQWRQLRLRLKPPFAHDWSVVNGRRYGYWGPMPAILLLPYVALVGEQASDMLLSCLIGMGTVFLTYLMLRQAHRIGHVPLTTAACSALTLLFGLGTVHFYVSVLGQVWFLSQVITTFFLSLAIWLFLHARNGIDWTTAAGAALAAAFLSRTSVLSTIPFFYAAMFALPDERRERPWLRAVRHGLCFSLPLVAAGALSLAFNYARFGNPFENGVRIQLLSAANPLFKNLYLQYGFFSLHYIPTNLYYYFLNPMLRRYPGTGAITFDPWGNSMFLVTPALLYVFRASPRRDGFTTSLWLGVGSCMTMLMLFQGTGWYGFGNRYLLDLMPLAILLIAIGMKGRLTRVSVPLIVLSILVNAWGTYRFCSEQF